MVFGVPQFKKPQCGCNLQYRECKGYSQTKQFGTIGYPCNRPATVITTKPVEQAMITHEFPVKKIWKDVSAYSAGDVTAVRL